MKKIHRNSAISDEMQMIFLMRLPSSANEARSRSEVSVIFAPSFLFLFHKNAGSYCRLINLQPACLSSLFFVKYELACVRLR